MLRELAEVMRRDEPIEWCGLRKKRGQQPSRIGGHLFMLGAAVDGGRQRADVAWRATQQFVLGTVPRRERQWVWDWIVRRHSRRQWSRMRRAYSLHRSRAWHDRIYRLAQFISVNLDGDPRNIWRKAPDEVDVIDHVRSVLYTMRFGPALSRMVVGALLDHGLVKGETAFKDDIHVRRGMRLLRLARTDGSKDVLESGRRFFGANSWKIDLALYRLGEQGYRTRAGIVKYYLDRVVNKRDEKVRQTWLRRRAEWRPIVQASRDLTTNRINDKGWITAPSSSRGYLGFTLASRRGRIATEFRSERLEIWSGVMANVAEASIEVWHEVGFDMNSSVARSLKVRAWLRGEGYKSSYDDATKWETHYKLLRHFPVTRRPGRVARGVSAAIARRAEKLVRMLEATVP